MVLRFRLLAAVVLVFMANVSIAASSASWNAVLRDGTGSPVAGAMIALTDNSGKAVFTATTTSAGEFIFSDITAAKYGIAEPRRRPLSSPRMRLRSMTAPI